ncbi:hypothetical protein IIA16_02930 [bacterium]|nr:hypothetical protein [bacterium]
MVPLQEVLLTEKGWYESSGEGEPDEDESKNELAIQRLVEDHPEVIPAKDLDLPGGLVMGTFEKWQIDLLLFDKSGRPVIGEVKRLVTHSGTKREARRYALAQAVDYAALLAQTDPDEVLDAARSYWRKKGGDWEEALSEAGFLNEDDEDPVGRYEDKVKAALADHRFLVLVVGDAIAPELERMIEFMNDNTKSNLAFAGVAIPQYRAGDGEAGLRVLAPRAFGLNVETRERVRPKSSEGSISAFAEKVGQQVSQEWAESVKGLLDRWGEDDYLGKRRLVRVSPQNRHLSLYWRPKGGNGRMVTLCYLETLGSDSRLKIAVDLGLVDATWRESVSAALSALQAVFPELPSEANEGEKLLMCRCAKPPEDWSPLLDL